MGRAYYAVIPAIVRYDKELTANAKLLYGELTALCNEKGYCWATNQYFADLYSVSKKSITQWIKQLEKRKYIETRLNYKENSKEVSNRFIWILPFPVEGDFYANDHDPREDIFPTSPQKGYDPREEKVRDNNTFNITNNNNMSSCKKSEQIPYSKIINYLNKKTNSKYSSKSANSQKLIKARWNEGNTLEIFLQVIDIKAKEWLGNVEMEAYLRPATLFNATKFENYKAQVFAEQRRKEASQSSNYSYAQQREDLDKAYEQ